MLQESPAAIDYSWILGIDQWSTEWDGAIEKIIADNGIKVDFIKVNSRVPAMFAPGRIYVSEALSGKLKLFTLLHELGHAYRHQTVGEIFNYFLKKDLNGNPISRNEALKAMMNEEQEATRWANKMIDKYDLKIQKHPTRYPPEVLEMSLSLIESEGAETVSEVVDLLYNKMITWDG
jgi:hypothetical protein